MQELRTVLALATEDELTEITRILFQPKFNPLDYLGTPAPAEICSQDRETWVYAIERRFQYLAADGLTVLRGRYYGLSYRDVLLQVCRHLKLHYRQQWSAIELENEIFLRLMEKVWEKMPADDSRLLSQRISRALAEAGHTAQLPPALQSDPMQLLLKGTGLVAFNTLVRPLLLRQFARQIAVEFAQYQMVRQVVAQGSAGVGAGLALRSAGQAVAASTVRYGAVRSVLAAIGPALWAWFLADLGWKAIATNYARVIPVIFTLAQIRLVRGDALLP